MECQDPSARRQPKGDKSQGLGAPSPRRTPSPGSGSDPFIVATGLDSIRPNTSARKFIRHHVMKGKNKVKKKKKRRAILQPSVSIGSWINREPGLCATSPIAARQNWPLHNTLHLSSSFLPGNPTKSWAEYEAETPPRVDETIHKCENPLTCLTQHDQLDLLPRFYSAYTNSLNGSYLCHEDSNVSR